MDVEAGRRLAQIAVTGEKGFQRLHQLACLLSSWLMSLPSVLRKKRAASGFVLRPVSNWYRPIASK